MTKNQSDGNAPQADWVRGRKFIADISKGVITAVILAASVFCVQMNLDSLEADRRQKFQIRYELIGQFEATFAEYLSAADDAYLVASQGIAFAEDTHQSHAEMTASRTLSHTSEDLNNTGTLTDFGRAQVRRYQGPAHRDFQRALGAIRSEFQAPVAEHVKNLSTLVADAHSYHMGDLREDTVNRTWHWRKYWRGDDQAETREEHMPEEGFMAGSLTLKRKDLQASADVLSTACREIAAQKEPGIWNKLYDLFLGDCE